MEPSITRTNARGGVAQLVRALPCHGRGRGFESRRSRHFINDLAMISGGQNRCLLVPENQGRQDLFMTSVRAMFFDVFGTLVDWRTSVAREAERVLQTAWA